MGKLEDALTKAIDTKQFTAVARPGYARVTSCLATTCAKPVWLSVTCSPHICDVPTKRCTRLLAKVVVGEGRFNRRSARIDRGAPVGIALRVASVPLVTAYPFGS